MNGNCNLYKNHHWHFACVLPTGDWVEEKKYPNNIGIEKNQALVRQNTSGTLLFYCPCGQMRTVMFSGSSISGSGSPVSYKIDGTY